MEEQGLDPEALKSKPVLSEELDEVAGAYVLLATRCSVGFSGRNPITLEAIESYVRMFGQPIFRLEDFIYLLSELEDEQGKKPGG